MQSLTEGTASSEALWQVPAQGTKGPVCEAQEASGVRGGGRRGSQHQVPMGLRPQSHLGLSSDGSVQPMGGLKLRGRGCVFKR